MKLNRIEFFMMNNILRNFIQKQIEIKRLRKFSNLSSNKTILEIGCGTGNGSKLIQKYFQTKKIYATDLDKKMIEVANKKEKENFFCICVQAAIERSIAIKATLADPSESFG